MNAADTGMIAHRSHLSILGDASPRMLTLPGGLDRQDFVATLPNLRHLMDDCRFLAKFPTPLPDHLSFVRLQIETGTALPMALQTKRIDYIHVSLKQDGVHEVLAPKLISQVWEGKLGRLFMDVDHIGTAVIDLPLLPTSPEGSENDDAVMENWRTINPHMMTPAMGDPLAGVAVRPDHVILVAPFCVPAPESEREIYWVSGLVQAFLIAKKEIQLTSHRWGHSIST